MAIKFEQLSSKLVGPTYNSDEKHHPLQNQFVPLSVFDRLTDDEHVPLLYAYRPPTPSNQTLERGLRKALSEYPEFAGRFGTSDTGERVILLNGQGLRFIEASFNCTLDEVIPFKSSTLLSLSPCEGENIEELTLVQLTRFTCGSLILSFSSNHMVADGFFASQFLVVWGQACRGLAIPPRSVGNRNIFATRDPLKVAFDHGSIEVAKRQINQKDNKPPYSGEYVIRHRARFTPDLLAKIKSKASSLVPDIMNGVRRPYTTFESLVAHLWRTVTKVRGLKEHETTEMKISVDGRRRLKPPVPDDYYGNLVLWAFPQTRVKDLLSKSLSYAAEIIHDSVVKVNDDYFKSFIDYAITHNMQDEDLKVEEGSYSVTSLWPNLEIDSWLGLPFTAVDFGVGKPCIFMPSFETWEGVIYVVPSFEGDGSIDVYITLYQQHLEHFDKICYSID
ncbi:hypothetical protein MKX01_027559 [Papaver californicum]|nr:hypothetical protein MKX01_027559 [Papaver californicum]